MSTDTALTNDEVVRRVSELLVCGFYTGQRVRYLAAAWRSQDHASVGGRIARIDLPPLPLQILVDFKLPSGNLVSVKISELRAWE